MSYFNVFRGRWLSLLMTASTSSLLIFTKLQPLTKYEEATLNRTHNLKYPETDSVSKNE